MFSDLIILFFYIVATEALSDLLVNSEIFSGFRKLLFTHRKFKILNFFHDLFDCVYCMSIWISFILLINTTIFSINTLIEFVVLWMVIHKLSILLHYFILKVQGYN
jgi:hypothetical protein